MSWDNYYTENINSWSNFPEQGFLILKLEY